MKTILFILITSNNLAMPPVVALEKFDTKYRCEVKAKEVRELTSEAVRIAKSTITVKCI